MYKKELFLNFPRKLCIYFVTELWNNIHVLYTYFRFSLCAPIWKSTSHFQQMKMLLMNCLYASRLQMAAYSGNKQFAIRSNRQYTICTSEMTRDIQETDKHTCNSGGLSSTSSSCRLKFIIVASYRSRFCKINSTRVKDAFGAAMLRSVEQVSKTHGNPSALSRIYPGAIEATGEALASHRRSSGLRSAEISNVRQLSTYPFIRLSISRENTPLSISQIYRCHIQPHSKFIQPSRDSTCARTADATRVHMYSYKNPGARISARVRFSCLRNMSLLPSAAPPFSRRSIFSTFFRSHTRLLSLYPSSLSSRAQSLYICKNPFDWHCIYIGDNAGRENPQILQPSPIFGDNGT